MLQVNVENVNVSHPGYKRNTVAASIILGTLKVCDLFRVAFNAHAVGGFGNDSIGRGGTVVCAACVLVHS